MADLGWRRASVRLRTTAAAVLVVAIMLVVGGFALVALVRDSLQEGAESAAENQVDALVAQLESGRVPSSPDEADPDDDDDEPDNLVWQVVDRDDGAILAFSDRNVAGSIPEKDGAVVDLGGEHRYVVARETADTGQVVTAAVSLEDVDESTAALITPLAVGLPLLLLLLGATTWVVVTRALAPVERIRREVDQITGDRLDRRVPEPPAQDEIHRLAHTMNQMLGRLEVSRTKQQQFVADASHELRSPLASIRQTAEVASAHPGALPEGELAVAVLEEGARMQRLVEQLLMLTRADEGAPRRSHDVDLDDLALAEARRVRRSGLTVDTSAVAPGRVRGDEVALAQVVRNLVDNAARHADGALAIAVRDVAGGVELVVDDDGPGIPEADRGRVFERFVRLDEARARDAGGSGLGLAIVKEIVASHDGTVLVSNSPLGGARLVVRFSVVSAS